MAWVRCGKNLMFSWLAFPLFPAGAMTESAPLNSDPHQVVFRYDKDSAYTILAQPGIPTDLELGADEKVQGLAMGDTVQWMIEELPGHLFIKPIKGDLFTAGTLVTDRRIYQLHFKSSADSGAWYQRVSWSYDDRSRPVPTNADLPPDPEHIPANRLNLAYEIEGDGDFRPEQVFDDGRFTYLKMNAPQSLPALFMLTEEGAELVNYRVQGSYFVVQRLMPGILLKLGNREIRVLNRQLGGRLKQKLKSAQAPINPFNHDQDQ